MFRVAVALFAATAAAVSAPVPKSVKVKQPNLDGRWEAVKMLSHGKDNLESNPWVWDISGETVTRYCRQDDGSLQLTDADTTSTLVRPEGGQSDEIDYILTVRGETRLFRGRFLLRDDELTLNFAEMNETRPSDMAAPKLGYHHVYKRVKDK